MEREKVYLKLFGKKLISFKKLANGEIIGTGFLTILVGVTTAWFVTAYRFPGRNFFNWTLILPLSIPATIQ